MGSTSLRVAVTGATGAVGAAVAAALADAGHAVRTVGRTGDFQWDLRQPLPSRAAFETVDAVVHCAADVRLGAPPAHLWRVNVTATEEILEAIAVAPSRPRLVHVSSAFAGAAADGHTNAYEESKTAAEQAVLRSGLDAALLRPSLVIGRRADGACARFSGVYTVLRLLALGFFPALPVDDAALVDLVPVDLVAQATVDMVEGSWSGQPVVSATSGASSPAVRWLFETACDALDRRDGSFQRPKLVPPDAYRRVFRPFLLPELSPAQRVLLETLEIFFPYFDRSHVFPSSLDVGPDEVKLAWRRSVDYWLERTGAARSAGEMAWRPRQVRRHG